MLSRETIVSGCGRCNLKIVTMEDEPWKSFAQMKNLRDIMDLRCRRAAVKDVARVGSCGHLLQDCFLGEWFYNLPISLYSVHVGNYL